MFCLFVFFHFLENDLLKVDKILGMTFFKARKDLEGFKTAFFPFAVAEFCARFADCLLLPFTDSRRRSRFVNSAFPNKKIWPKNRGLFMTNKSESKCLQKFYVSSK